MKKITSNKKIISTVARLILKILWILSAIKLVILASYLKIKTGQFPKNYSEFIYYFTKTRAIFEEKDYFVKRIRLEKLIELFLERGISGYKIWREGNFFTSLLFQKNSSYKNWRKSNYLNENIIKSIIESTSYLDSKEGVLISLVMPVYRTDPKYLKECIESVINQIFENWELIIVNDGSKSRIIENILNKYKHSESRIRVISLEENQGIVFATNIGIKQAKGDYIGFLDHDDLLSRDALFLVAKVITINPKLDYIYTDEDKIDEKGNHYDPNFKGEFNALMAKFHNYTHHLSLYSSRIIANIGELDENVSGAQDFDLFLKSQNFLLNEHVCHIPYICYHWRAHVESTALKGTQKKYVLDAAKKSILNSLKREQIDCELILPKIAKNNGWTLWQPLWSVGDISGLVTILIPTKNKGELLLNCIESIKKTCRRIPKIIIVDDNSDEYKTIEIFRLLENDTKLNIEIIKSPHSDNKFNYARLINFGAEKITTKFFVQLNNDIEAVSTNWIDQMVGWMQFKDIGVVGAKLKYPNGKLQHAGVVIGPNGGLADHQFHGLPGDWPGYTSLPHISREVSAVTGACLLTDTELFRTLGGFDEVNFAVEFNDVDYCLRAKKVGRKTVYAAEVELTHITSASRGNIYNPQEHINFLEKYRGYEDVHFSPNIDIDSMQMSHFSSKLIYKDIAPKPRLIIFSHALSRTGAPITAIEFALEMNSRGYDIEFITFEDGPLKKQLIESEINVYDLNLSKSIYNVVYKEIEDKIGEVFLSIVLRPDRDIVICNTALTFIAINVANSNGIKTIWHIHENSDYLSFVSLLGDPDLRKVSMQALDEVDMVIFQSEATKKLYKNYFSHEKILKISGGMPIERIWGYIKANEKSSVKKKLGIIEGPHIISIIGTTCDRKGQKEFLEAIEQIDWQSLRDHIGEVIVLIVGKVESDYSLVLEEQASKIKHLDIRIIDEVSNIYDYYFISDTFVCASKEESFPMVVLLAMIFNVPIVSTLAGGIGEMLQDGHDATVAANYSSRAIKEALFKSLTNKDRVTMAKRAYAKILRFFDNKILYNKHEEVIFYLTNQ
jgi:glycosyltransferase involved in cell wall biosynthesis